MSDTVTCPDCGEEYTDLGKHWYYSPDHRPSFTEHQREIIIGLLMGDGSIDTCNKNPIIDIEMISPNYLEYLDEQFGCLTTGVSLKKTAAESAQHNRDREFSPNAKEENYSDMYRLRSRTHPELQEFADWYSSGEKVWPEDIELTPTVLKHWYCGDGHWHNSEANNCISIAMANEISNTNKIDEIFRNVGIQAPSNYSSSERKGGSFTCNADFTVEQSKELWEYMGKPLPDFEYKWPERYH